MYFPFIHLFQGHFYLAWHRATTKPCKLNEIMLRRKVFELNHEWSEWKRSKRQLDSPWKYEFHPWVYLLEDFRSLQNFYGLYSYGTPKSFFGLNFSRSSRKAFSDNRATFPIFYIGSPTRHLHGVTDNTPRTYASKNLKNDLGVA